MKKHKILTNPTPLSNLSFDDMDDTDERQLKAERWEVQRWRKIKHQVI